MYKIIGGTEEGEGKTAEQGRRRKMTRKKGGRCGEYFVFSYYSSKKVKS
jgi:hypothetical protein